MNKEQILIEKYGCKDLEDLKKCFLDNCESLSMILEAMEEYAQLKVKNNVVLGDVIKCEICESKHLKSDNLCEDCYNSLPS